MPARALLAIRAFEPLRAALGVFVWTRLGVLAVAAFAAYLELAQGHGLAFLEGQDTAAALALPLSFPVGPQPLMSLPRFLAVQFPIFMWLALACEERRITDRVAAGSALVLGLFTAQFATWHWIA